MNDHANGQPATQTTRVDRARAFANEFLNRSGMSPVDFARRIHYSPSTLAQFRSGHYAAIADADRISAAILDFIASQPLDEQAFDKKIYETGAVRTLRSVFARLLEEPQMYLVYAPPGSGKTDVARYLIAQHNRQRSNDDEFIFRVYCRERICPRDLMKRVATKCGTQSDTAIDRALHNLAWDFRGKRVVLYFDEAQHLSLSCFETVRELLDEAPHFSLCFAGAEDLGHIFARFAGTLERFERRITDKITLPPVTAEEAAGILRSELGDLDLGAAEIRRQIDLATTTVRIEKKVHRYISIGRIMAAIAQIRKAAPMANADQPAVAVATDSSLEVA
jgi:Cdc6-like AAA superfamily ATPase